MLSPKERQEIIDLRQKGFTYRSIANKVHHSLPTVSKVLEEAKLTPIVMLRKYHNEILVREREMGTLDEQLEGAHWPTDSVQAKNNIAQQNKLGEEITDILWEVRSILFEL